MESTVLHGRGGSSIAWPLPMTASEVGRVGILGARTSEEGVEAEEQGDDALGILAQGVLRFPNKRWQATVAYVIAPLAQAISEKRWGSRSDRRELQDIVPLPAGKHGP